MIGFSNYRLRGLQLLPAVALIVGLSAAYLASTTTVASGAGNSYYVDGVGGSDSNSGTSPTSAWKSLAVVQSRTFNPGDTLNFKRGSSWGGGLTIKNSGASGSPITLKAYGTGPNPVITNAAYNGDAIRINGSYVVVQDFLLKDAPHGGVYLSGNHNVVQGNEMSNTGTGVSFHGQYNLATRNYVHDLTMIVNTPGGVDDYGANGVIVLASNNEVSYNRFVNCRAPSYDFGHDGGAVELYGNLTNVNVHHNYSTGGDGFLEMGGGSANNVTVAYNVSDNDYNQLILVHLTGTWASTMSNFKVENNTIVKTISAWKILNFDGTPSPSTFYFRNNVVYSTQAGVANNAAFTHANNLYFLANGATLGFTLGSGEKQADPLFANLAGGDYHLRTGSPAIDAGLRLGYTLDFGGNAVPAGAAPDMGVFEAAGSPAVPSPTPTSVPANTPAPASTPVPSTPTPAAAAVPPSPTATATPVPPTATATPVPSQGGLVNGGFESGLTGWYLPSWFTKVVGVVNSGARSGSAALRFQGASNGPHLQQDLPASPGQQVSFSGWVNVSQLGGGSTMIVDLVARTRYNGDIKSFPMATFSSTSPKNQWLQVTGSALLPANTATVRVRVRFPNLNGTVYLDDLSLR